MVTLREKSPCHNEKTKHSDGPVTIHAVSETSKKDILHTTNGIKFREYEVRGRPSHVMRKPVYAKCEQQRRRSACAPAQSDQRLCFSLFG